MQNHQLKPQPYAHATLVALLWAFDIGEYEEEEHGAKDYEIEAVKRLRNAFDRWALYDPFLVHAETVLVSEIFLAATRCLNKVNYETLNKVSSVLSH